MPRLLCPSWRWITISGTPSRAISTAWAWRSWWGAKRQRTPAAAAVRRSSARAAAGDQWRPRVVPLMTQNSGPTGSPIARGARGRVVPSPMRPSQPRDGDRPCPVGPGASRGVDRGRLRWARALPGCAALIATGSRSDRVGGRRAVDRRQRTWPRQSLRPWADPPDSAAACCAEPGPRGIRASSLAMDVDRRGRAAARTWPLLGFVDDPTIGAGPCAADSARPPRYRFRPRAAVTTDPWTGRLLLVPQGDSDGARPPSDRQLTRALIVPMHGTQRVRPSGASVGRRQASTSSAPP